MSYHKIDDKVGVDFSMCIECTMCVAECPSQAIDDTYIYFEFGDGVRYYNDVRVSLNERLCETTVCDVPCASVCPVDSLINLKDPYWKEVDNNNNPNNGGGSSGTKNASDWAPDHVDDSDLEDKNPCAYSAYSALSTSNNLFNNLLGSFINTKVLNIQFKVGNISDPANTNLSQIKSHGLVTITLNCNMMGSSPLFLASLLIHEMLHAKMAYNLVNAGWDGGEFADIANLNPQSYPTLLKYYKDYFKPQDADHAFFADWYVDKIATALSEFDNNAMDIDYYKKFAWSGIGDSPQYKNLPEDFQKDVYDIYKANQKDLPCPSPKTTQC